MPMVSFVSLPRIQSSLCTFTLPYHNNFFELPPKIIRSAFQGQNKAPVIIQLTGKVNLAKQEAIAEKVLKTMLEEKEDTNKALVSLVMPQVANLDDLERAIDLGCTDVIVGSVGTISPKRLLGFAEDIRDEAGTLGLGVGINLEGLDILGDLGEELEIIRELLETNNFRFLSFPLDSLVLRGVREIEKIRNDYPEIHLGVHGFTEPDLNYQKTGFSFSEYSKLNNPAFRRNFDVFGFSPFSIIAAALEAMPITGASDFIKEVLRSLSPGWQFDDKYVLTPRNVTGLLEKMREDTY